MEWPADTRSDTVCGSVPRPTTSTVRGSEPARPAAAPMAPVSSRSPRPTEAGFPIGPKLPEDLAFLGREQFDTVAVRMRKPPVIQADLAGAGFLRQGRCGELVKSSPSFC